MPNHDIESILENARLFLQNVQQTPAIQQRFAAAGRDAAYFQQGQAYLDEVERLNQQQDDEYGDQYTATDTLHQKREVAHDTYMGHLGLARIAFEDDPDAQQALRLNGSRKQALPAWLAQASAFYDGLLTDDTPDGPPSQEDRTGGGTTATTDQPAARRQALAVFGVTRQELEAGRDEVDAVARVRQEREQEAAQAQRVTEERDAALDRLEDFVGQNRRLARVLFRRDPQHLEALGLTAR